MTVEAILEDEERQYVPDVRCPNCGKVIELDARTYAFYNGEIRCDGCMAVMQVRIGDSGGTNIPGYREKRRGGFLLTPPKLASPPASVPEALL